MPHTNTVLSQLLRFLSRHEIESLACASDGKRKSNAMNRFTQLVALMVGQLGGQRSLRDIESTVVAQSHLRYHLGIGAVSRSSLARANHALDAAFFVKLFESLYSRCVQHTSKHQLGFKGKLFSLDASLIDVSMKLFPQTDYNSRKAAFKLHVGLDHDGLIPAFASLTEGKVSDMEQARKLHFEKGSVVVFDKGYNSYRWHKSLSDQGVNFVTRIRGNAKFRVLVRHPVDKTSPVTSDQLIEYTSVRAQGMDLQPVRRVGYRCPETGRHYVFITNHLHWPAQLVADIYKQRWQVELFFKWIKQNLKIKSFLGHSTNAVMTQVMVALICYLLLAYLKSSSKISKSLQQMTRLLKLNLFAKRDLIELLKPEIRPSGISTPQMALALTRI